MDVKTIVLSCAISIAVGGGIYGLYLKNFSSATLTQGKTYSLLQECINLDGSLDKVKIERFLQKVEDSINEINKSDATIAALGVATEQSDKEFHGMGKPLSECLKKLPLEL